MAITIGLSRTLTNFRIRLLRWSRIRCSQIQIKQNISTYPLTPSRAGCVVAQLRPHITSSWSAPPSPLLGLQCCS